MSKRNVDTLRRAHDAFNRRNFDESARLVSNEIQFSDHARNTRATTRAEFREWVASHTEMSSNLVISEPRYIDGGEWVTAMFRVEGTHDGVLGSFAPTGKRFGFDVCEVWRFDIAGEAVEGHNYSDGLGIMSQLGLIDMGSTAT